MFIYHFSPDLNSVVQTTGALVLMVTLDPTSALEVLILVPNLVFQSSIAGPRIEREGVSLHVACK